MTTARSTATGFQLFRFEVIGEQTGQFSGDPDATAAAVSNYSDLK